MSRRSTALGVLTAAVLAVPLTQVAGADEPTGQRAPAVGEVGYALIHGKVVDQKTGKAIDDVQVQAVRQKEVKGVTGASDLTYASPDNAIKHGYFAMHVPHGTYTVTFSKKDYAPVERAVRRKQEQQAGIGEVLLTPLPETKLQTSTRVIVVKDLDRPTRLKVRLLSDVRQKPTGTLTVWAGERELVSKTVKSGIVELTLSGLDKDVHSVTVVYSGDERHHSAKTGIPVRVQPTRG